MTICYVILVLYVWNSSSDFMKKLSEIGQQKPADNAEQADTDEQSSKKLKVTDELRWTGIFDYF